MSFAHPWMLWGALAAFIPLLVHLFDRRRPRPHPFAAISFVLRSQRRTASRLKLKRLLLYILRTLLLIALPVALARPEWKKAGAAALSAHGPAATAIILDASLSMRFADKSPLFNKGKALAKDAVRDLLPEEPATLLVCGPGAGAPSALAFDRARLLEAVDEAQPTFGHSDLNACMELAARALEDSPLAAKRLVLVTDLTAGAFRLESPPPTVKGPKGEPVRPEVELRDVAQGRERLDNRAVVDLKVEPALQVGPRAFQFTFTLRNYSPQPVKDLEASLRVGNQVVAKGFVDLPANGAAQKSLTHRFEAGGTFSGEVAVAPDALAADDRRAFVLGVPRELKALVVNGGPNAVRYRDEAFFVEAALGAPGSPVRPTVRDAEAAYRERFEDYDLVLLLNAPAPPPETVERLSAFVQNGGGLLVSMGDHVEPDAYNQRLGKLLPRPLRLTKTAAAPTDPDAHARAAKLTQVSAEHPVFALFTGAAREGLMGARTYRYMLLEAEEASRSAKEAAQVLASFEDGAPAVAVARRGQGRVALLTTSVDRDWSDLAIRTSFLPLIQRFAAYLCGSLEEREQIRARVGESVTLRSPAGVVATSAKGPSDRELTLRAQPDGTVVAGPLTEPGPHEVRDAAGKPIPSLAFAATLDPAESDLTRLRMEELQAYFGEDSLKQAGGEGQERRTPFWTWLIVAAAVAFFLEGVLLRR